MQAYYIRVFLLIVASVLIPACSAVSSHGERAIEKTEVTSFKPVAKQIAELKQRYGANNLLLVLDIDNTLLTSTVDLGGDIWYQWQRGYLVIKPSASQKVACLFEDSIGLLYELAPMELTDENLPQLILRWQQQGLTLMALTSRAPKYRAATERELARNGIDFEPQALAPKGQSAPLYREVVDRELSYMKGIMMTSGMNKGEMLDLILAKTRREFDAIVFVDDSQKNIDAVYEAYKSRSDIDTRIFHYTKIEADRKAKHGAVLTQAQADKMDADWQRLRVLLGEIFPARNISDGCLSPN